MILTPLHTFPMRGRLAGIPYTVQQQQPTLDTSEDQPDRDYLSPAPPSVYVQPAVQADPMGFVDDNAGQSTPAGSDTTVFNPFGWAHPLQVNPWAQENPDIAILPPAKPAPSTPDAYPIYTPSVENPGTYTAPSSGNEQTYTAQTPVQVNPAPAVIQADAPAPTMTIQPANTGIVPVGYTPPALPASVPASQSANLEPWLLGAAALFGIYFLSKRS